MNISIIGINHKTAPIEVRELFFLTPTQQELFLSELKSRPEVIEAFVLSTCNRTEVYLHLLSPLSSLDFVIDLIVKIKKASLKEAPVKWFYVHRNEGAVNHLFRVACGLDSLVLGEIEILGQVKMAVERARDKTMFGKVFNVLSNIAIRTGKKARHETEISGGGSSVSWAAVSMIEEKLGTLNDKTVLIIGAGKMSELAVKQIYKKGIRKLYLMNRTESNAASLADIYNGNVVSFCDIKEILTEVDVAICSVGAPHYILEAGTAEKIMSLRGQRPLFLIDISMPRNIDPGIAHVPGISLYHIDDLDQVFNENMRRRQQAAKYVEKIIDQQLREFQKKIKKLQEATSSDYFDSAKTS